jgi:very-short-patch-repair endonuclease
VASKNHQALDAVEERLGALAPETPFVIRTLNGGEVDRSFPSVLAEIIQGETRRMTPPDEGLISRLSELSRQRGQALDLSEQRDNLECNLAELLERIEAKARFAPLAPEPLPLSFRQKLWAIFRAAPEQTNPLEEKLAALRKARDDLGAPQDPVALTDEVTELAGRLMAPLLAKRVHISPDQRDRLDQFYADANFAKRSLSPDLARSILDYRPLWLASVLGTPKRIPLEPGLFDLVIFDEASQCDIASALPLFARAKRAVVVGDSRQLNFIAGIGIAQDRNLMQAQGLPIESMGRFAQSRQSLFDFAQRVPGAARTLLRQQYRSAGPIVDYISDAFYGGALKTAYDPDRIKPPPGQKPGIEWTHVPAPMSAETANVNSAEVRAITAHLSELFAQGYSGTVGVTTPFRDQVLALEEAIQTAIPATKLEAADFRVATVDGFQGQERDVILFSPVVGAASRMTTVTFLQKDHRRLNVAISRARAVAHVFGDLDFARSGRLRTLAALASAATEPRKRRGEGVFDSEWERILDAAMRARGLAPVPQYEIAGRRLDFALFGRGDIKLDIEVDGRFWHQNIDGSRKLSDLWRDHQLKSLGWRVRRFWVDELSRDMEACLDLIERDLATVSQ